MVSHAEKQKLLQELERQSGGSAATVPACATGLLILAACALVGTAADPHDARVAQGPEHPRYSAAMATSKRVLDERRARLEAQAPQRPEIAQR